MTAGRCLAFCSALLLLCCHMPASGDEHDALRQCFVDPPRDARPGAYWAWINGNVDLAQLTREMEQMKAAGLSKLYIFECGAQDKLGIVPVGPAFMGPESIKAIAHAVREAGRLGMELGLTTSSSWNAGGNWVEPRHASMGLYQSKIAVTGPAKFSAPLPFPDVPDKTPKRADGLPVFWREVAVLAVPAEGSGFRVQGSGSPNPQSTPVDAARVVDLSDKLDAAGNLKWDVPEGSWTVMRLVCTNTGQQLAIPSPNSQGLAIDHFSAEATRMHFDYFFDKLTAELGELDQTALTTMYVCSYELRGAAWTPDFLDQFRRRRGYDMKPYLPVLFGATIADAEVAARFEYDYRKTQGDLLVDAFYKTARDASREQGLLLCAEAGGPGPPTHNVPVDALKAQGVIDVPRGEFWTDDRLWVVKETACAAHIYGKKIVDMEAFTSFSHWQDGPLDLKPFADRAMCDGTNRFTFHTSPHVPPAAGLPGFVYHAGTHFGSSLAWWPMAPAFVEYLARSCALLQEGRFVADVCYYYGDQAYNFVPRKTADPGLGFGYDYDVAGAEVILTRMDAQEGRIVLPDGMSYEILVLPDRDDVDLEVLEKVATLVEKGATVVGPKPARSTGLFDYRRRDQAVRKLADRVWGPCDGQTIKEHAYGRGKVIWGRSLREILTERGLGPDFQFVGGDSETSLDYIHRRADGADIYFVRNQNPRWEEVDCVFRASAGAPELWLPDSGEIRLLPACRTVVGGTQAPLVLPPLGAVFVVFSERASKDHVVAVRRDGRRIFPVSPVSAPGRREIGCFELQSDTDGQLQMLIAQAGTYQLETAGGRTARIDVPRLPQPLELKGPWTVRFAEGWGAPASKVFDRLYSWSEDAEPGVKYFSGLATYEKTFDVPADLAAPGGRVFLDLGRVEEAADVWLNGKHLGIAWTPPLRFDVTDVLRPGENQLVVKVANTWNNRLVGDALSPDGPQFCRTNITGFDTWKTPWKSTPLKESGLLGPVQVQWCSSIPVE